MYIFGSIVGGLIGAFLYQFIGREATEPTPAARREPRRGRSLTPPTPAKEHPDMATTAPIRAMKKLINDVDDIVPESLAGLGRAHAGRRHASTPPTTSSCGPAARVAGKVALVSGGGSGHEPLHGGFVGLGMLDAACAGNVFTSPVPDQMEAATRAVDGGAGVLHIVKNYTGDVLNFQLAAELVAGEIEVATVVTNDDVAVQDSLYTAGRRGVGGTVLRREDRRRPGRGRRLARRRHRDRGQGQRQRALDGHGADRRASCRPPARRRSTSADDEMEIGIGIHGEPGRRREKLAPVDDIAGDARRPDRRPTSGCERGDSVLAFVNGMGGTPLIELYIAYNSVAKILDGQGIAIGRSASSGTTSRASRWPASRSRSCASTMSSSGCGTRRSTRPALRWGV